MPPSGSARTRCARRRRATSRGGGRGAPPAERGGRSAPRPDAPRAPSPPPTTRRGRAPSRRTSPPRPGRSSIRGWRHRHGPGGSPSASASRDHRVAAREARRRSRSATPAPRCDRAERGPTAIRWHRSRAGTGSSNRRPTRPGSRCRPTSTRSTRARLMLDVGEQAVAHGVVVENPVRAGQDLPPIGHDRQIGHRDGEADRPPTQVTRAGSSSSTQQP